jgi:hypothetical protein
MSMSGWVEPGQCFPALAMGARGLGGQVLHVCIPGNHELRTSSVVDSRLGEAGLDQVLPATQPSTKRGSGKSWTMSDIAEITERDSD